jgi:hypothetical protein
MLLSVCAHDKGFERCGRLCIGPVFMLTCPGISLDWTERFKLKLA